MKHNEKASAVEVSRTAEKLARGGEPDPMPPEGTDESVLKDGSERPLSEKDRVKATQAVTRRS